MHRTCYAVMDPFNAYWAFVKFGPDVLLDAIWDVDKIQHCSKSFHALLIVLSSKRPPEMTAVGATSKNTFKYMVSSLGVDDLFNYVKTEKTPKLGPYPKNLSKSLIKSRRTNRLRLEITLASS